MGYRVRNEDGELRFQSFEELRDGYLQQLVGPDDEVLEDGSSTWRKASSLPRLASALAGHQAAPRAERRWYLVAVFLLGLLVALASYVVSRGFDLTVLAIALALALGLLAWTTMRAMRRGR